MYAYLIALKHAKKTVTNAKRNFGSRRLIESRQNYRKRSRLNVSPSDTFRNLFHPRRAVWPAVWHLHRLRLRHWRVQKGLLPQAQILFRFPQCVLLVCFPVIRPFPHKPINRTPHRTGTNQPHSFSVPQVSSCKQVVSKLHASYINRSVIQGGSFLSYLIRSLSLYLFPLFFRLPFFFSNPPYPPHYFPPPPYGSRVYLIPHTPYIIYIIYILLLSILLTSPQRYIYSPLFRYKDNQNIYSFIYPTYLVWFCFVVDMRRYSIFIHAFFLWIHVSFGVRRYRYIYSRLFSLILCIVRYEEG